MLRLFIHAVFLVIECSYIDNGKRVADRYDALTLTTYNGIFGALLVLSIAIYGARAVGPAANWRAIPLPAWIALLYMALFSSVLAYFFYFWLLRYLEVTQLSSFSYLLPITATILGIFFLGERGAPSPSPASTS